MLGPMQPLLFAVRNSTLSPLLSNNFRHAELELDNLNLVQPQKIRHVERIDRCILPIHLFSLAHLPRPPRHQVSDKIRSIPIAYRSKLRRTVSRLWEQGSQRASEPESAQKSNLLGLGEACGLALRCFRHPPEQLAHIEGGPLVQRLAPSDSTRCNGRSSLFRCGRWAWDPILRLTRTLIGVKSQGCRLSTVTWRARAESLSLGRASESTLAASNTSLRPASLERERGCGATRRGGLLGRACSRGGGLDRGCTAGSSLRVRPTARERELAASGPGRDDQLPPPRGLLLSDSLRPAPATTSLPASAAACGGSGRAGAAATALPAALTSQSFQRSVAIPFTGHT
eukprot:1630238-Rhodomonas_salina.2